MQQNNPFNFGAHTGFQNTIPAFANNYIQQRPMPHLTQPDTDGSQGISYAQNTRQGFAKVVHNQSQTIKSEPQWSGPGNSPSFDSANTKNVTTASPTNRGNEVNFGTEVDTLMKAIQAKSTSTTQHTTSSVDQSRPVVSISRTLLTCKFLPKSERIESGQFKFTQNDL
jgi:hypothetical protein